MAEERLPLLRGRISAVDTYESPRGPGKQPPLPPREPSKHRALLLQQLDAIEQAAHQRNASARDELATREIIAVHPAAGAQLVAEQLDDARGDVRLIGTDPDTGVVLLDAPSAKLEHLREKAEAFGDDAQVKPKMDRAGNPATDEAGNVIFRRADERAIAPIEWVQTADVADRAGERLRSEAVQDDRPVWLEIACRGGYYRPLAETDASRIQIARQLNRVGAAQRLDEFVGPEQVYFFLRLTRIQLDALARATDCIYEVELAPPPLRDLRLLEDVSARDVRGFSLTPPPTDAPSVVILDTGIATSHPLLASALLSATTAGPEIPSPEDTYGHGTKMAGLALYKDLGAALEKGRAHAPHWIQSSRLVVSPGKGTAADENYEKWPVLTLGAIRSAEENDPQRRNRVFVLALTRSMQEPPLDGLNGPTLWSHSVDQSTYNDGLGRLLIVSAGNARYDQWLALAEQHPQLQLSEKIHQPAQAANALTVGAFTKRIELPLDKDYAEAQVVAKIRGGISPYTSTGILGSDWPIKPDVVFEGGNLAISPGPLPDESVPTLSALTTSNRHNLGSPLGQLSMTSEAAARAARFAAEVWTVQPKLRPETVRGLVVHSASWTDEMQRQFESEADRLAACGYGVPDESFARECASDRATIFIEDAMPNGVLEEEPKKTPPKRATSKVTELKLRRKVKLYKLPLPNTLLVDTDPEVELRVTLSYFAEPYKYHRRIFHGLDLKWDMQGPQESAEQFLERINVLKRPKNAEGKRQRTAKTKSFDWDIGIQARSRGTAQSDRWRGRMSALVEDKLIAVVPVLGWWEQRRELQRTATQRFSLIVTVRGPGVYAAIKPHVEVPVTNVVEV